MACIVLVASLPAVCAAESLPHPPDRIVTGHRLRIDGKRLDYQAETGRLAIRDVETGEPHGYVFYTAYRVPTAVAPRPVTFVWNGGPGADSSTLHFHVVGPKLVEGDHLADNPDTWLAVTDLVFVDPVGTGFSRPARPEYAAEFYGTVGDVHSITEFVRSWRLLHDAEDAPLFLVGESWGAGRAASVAYALLKRKVMVDGLVLISGGSGLRADTPPPLRAALRVVDVSATALFHARTPADLGSDPTALRRAAEQWARDVYAPALAQAGQLSDTGRDAIIAQLSRFTGLPGGAIDRKTLTITPRAFRTGLLHDQGKVLDTFDMRRTTGVEETASPAMVRYLRRHLGYRTDLPYLGLEEATTGYAPSGTYPESVNERWNYATAPVTPEAVAAAVAAAEASGSGPPSLGPPLPSTAEALELNPRMRVLVAAGLYDSFANCTGDTETARRLSPAQQRAVTFKCYVGGHMMYRDPPARLELTRDVMELIAGARR